MSNLKKNAKSSLKIIILLSLYSQKCIVYITQPIEWGSKKPKQPIREIEKFEVFALHLMNGLSNGQTNSTDLQKVRKRAD